MNKVLSKTWSIFTTAVVILAVILAILLVGVRIFGLIPFTILSGSMEPTYHVGSLIYVKDVPAEEIKVGDPITFVLNEDLVVATHRVVEIIPESEHFVTKGDANDIVDASPVYFKNLIGKPIFTIPYLGYISNYLTTPPGMYVGGSVVIVILLLMLVPDLIKRVDKKDKEKALLKEEANDTDDSSFLNGQASKEETEKAPEKDSSTESPPNKEA